MKPTRTRTERLDMIPATLETLRSDRQTLARLLDAAIPGSWPPPLLDDDTRDAFTLMIAEKGDPFFAAWYWVRDDPAEGGRVLIGCAAIATPPTADDGGDTVLIGYTVLDEFQSRGYATEAVRHLIPVIFSVPGIRRITATTYPELGAAIRVLEKNGFSPAGEGFEEGTIAYVLEKDD